MPDQFQFGERLLEPPKSAVLRRSALDVLTAALTAVDPYEAVRRSLDRDGNALVVNGRAIDLERVGRVIVVGAGKAGAPMSAAVEDVLQDRISAGWVNVKTGHSGPTRLVHVHEAGHPIPDDDGVSGSGRIVDLLRGLQPSDLVLCLISGGGSALLASPYEGISLDDLQAVTDALLRAGADINQLNAVRKHLERLKGGGLVRLAAPARVIGLVLSDVIGDPLDVIASGPTAPDSTTFADAWRVIEQFNLADTIPASVAQLLKRGLAGEEHDTPKVGDAVFERVENVIIGSNAQAVQAALATARRKGWNCVNLGSRIDGEARDVGRALGGIARVIVADGKPLKQPACLIAGGETVVKVTGAGRGGRNQEVALGAALTIEGLPDTLVCSLGTDGTDGPTDAAGAVADGTTLRRAAALGLDPHIALAENNAYAFFDALGDLLITGPTRTNVNDLMCVFVGAPGFAPHPSIR